MIQITLKAARVNRNLSQTEAAAMLGISANTLCNYEVGNTIPNATMLQNMAKLYGVSMDYIILPNS